MIVKIHFRLKRISIYIFSIIAVLLLLSLSLFYKKLEDDILPFNKSELLLSDSDNFFHLKENFIQAVPNISQFRFHQNSAKSCSSNPPTLLIIVHSAPTHILHRKVIRSTWGSSIPNLTVRTIFILGRSLQPQVWQRVKREANENGDIVLVDIIDSYRNLTLKHLIGIHWVLKNCNDVPYVLKTDDDAFIDMHRVKNMVLPNLPLHTIACRIVPSGTVPRRSGKWKVSRKEYPLDDYPEYCSGLAYFTRPFTLKSINKAALSGNVPYLWIDDVFVTGFCATYAETKRMDLSVWFSRTEEQVIQWLEGNSVPHQLPWMVSEMTPRHWPALGVAIWNKTKAIKNV